MNISILAAGAAGMYCGSCLRDNALAGALMRLGHKVTLVPLYTPLKTDSADKSIEKVFYGGINSYLQYASGLFRHTPRALDWLFDRPWLLNWAGKFGAQTSPAKLGPFVMSILQGHEGPQAKELERLADFLADDIKPQVASLPNLMFAGAAQHLHKRLGVPIICELTGEDIFLDAMAEPYRTQAQEAIRRAAPHVTRFIATSRYYADRMAEYLAMPRERIEVVYPGITADHFTDANAAEDRPPTVGYFARICPEKGLHKLVEAFAILRRMPGMEKVRLRAAGHLGAAHEAWYADLQKRIAADGLADAFEYAGEVDLAGKLRFLDSVDVLSVPTVYAEAKGMYVLEGLARGVPVVQPDHGAFGELVSLTGGGVLVPPSDAQALASALAKLLSDGESRRAMGDRGRKSVREAFTDAHMAQRMLQVYQEAIECRELQQA